MRTPIPGTVAALPSLARAALRVGLVLAVLLAVAIVAIWIFQERLVFLPPPTPAQQGRGATRVDFRTPAGQSLFGFFVGDSAAAAARRIIIVFHGNGDLADSWIDWARETRRRTGWDVFLAEYRGYGGIAGSPSYRAVRDDARATVEFVLDHFGVPAARVAVYGHSLGTGVAADLGTVHAFHALILESPFTSIDDVGRRNFGSLLGWAIPLVSRFDFAPLRDVRTSAAPVWALAGDGDPIAPPAMARAVFDAARNRGEILVVAGAGHGDVALVAGDRYWSWLERALR